MVEYNHRKISIHALREEGDPVFANLGEQAILFLSTPSARRATTAFRVSSTITKFLSTPSARRATRGQQAREVSKNISIHALREEGDVMR